MSKVKLSFLPNLTKKQLFDHFGPDAIWVGYTNDGELVPVDKDDPGVFGVITQSETGMIVAKLSVQESPLAFQSYPMFLSMALDENKMVYVAFIDGALERLGPVQSPLGTLEQLPNGTVIVRRFGE